MYPLLVVLLLSIPSLVVNLEFSIETGDGNSILLSGYISHEHFYTALSDQIGIKVMNASLGTLVHSKQNIDEFLTQINYIEYTFLQIFHSLATGDVSFTNQLIELYHTFRQKLGLSDYFKSHIMFLTEPTYSAVNSILHLSHDGLKHIPEEITKEILLVTNKSSVFHEAARRGNIGVIKWLLQYVSESERCSVLETAWQEHRYDIVKMLIKSNVTFVKPGMIVIGRRNDKGESILHLAAELKNPHFVKSLLESGAQVNTSDGSGTTPLFRAVKNNDIVTAKMLIEKQADVNAATKTNYIPLHEAAKNGNPEMVKLLLASGSTVNKISDEGITPLLISEKLVFKETIEYLFWSNSITMKELQNDLKFLYVMTSYETANRTTRRRRIYLDRVLDYSVITKELLLRGEKTYIPNDLKSKVCSLVMKLGITKLAESMFNIDAKLYPEQYSTQQIFRAAIENDNHELVALMLSEGMSENMNFGSTSLLQLAADRGSVTIFNLLLKKGANLRKISKNRGSMLHVASAAGKESIVRYLLNGGYRVDSLDPEGNTPLFYAAIEGKPQIVKLLLEYKANISARNVDNETALFYAVYGGDAKTIDTLIEKGAKTEVRNNDGETPLIAAANGGEEPVLASLIKAGAEIDVRDNANRTPLEISISRQNINTTRLLLENGVNPNTLDTQSRTSLHLAVSSGSLETVELLIKKGVLINRADANGHNALHDAVVNKSLSIVQLLVASGINIDAKDMEGKTPLDYAITVCSRDIASFLVKKRAVATILANPKCIIGD